MQRFVPMIGVAAVALTITALTACSAPPTIPVETVAAGRPTTSVLAPHPPPPRRAEIPPPAPSPQALWKYGHWRWNGLQYVWVPGHYAQRPSRTANWIPDYWEHGPEGWMWVEGQWTS